MTGHYRYVHLTIARTQFSARAAVTKFESIGYRKCFNAISAINIVSFDILSWFSVEFYVYILAFPAKRCQFDSLM